ncbi:hypothetical protein BG015_008502 [Linnemannia schmuckeri]|uniref:F-box protein n=1 Tax=Linnemannia schmuckeri TaxID=64567 RepID=A0A9P5S9Y2_9FUNG|nr:hypothetical protein BG015_008502 [Linnemannia schmuckeri]
MPAHYYSVLATYDQNRNHDPDFDDSEPGPVHSIFRSAASTLALSNNVHHIRELVFKLNDIVYYTNCVFAFQDFASQAAIGQQQRQEQHFPSRPLWIAPPDPLSCCVLPIPPVTFLTKLEIDIAYFDGFVSCPYYLPSSKDPRATATHICWILRLNPHLTDIVISGLSLKDDRDVRLFSMSMVDLDRLQKLSLLMLTWKEMTRVRLAPTIFYCCPPSLPSLRLEIREEDMSGYAFEFTDECCLQEPGELLSWEKEDEEWGLTTIARRQGPLQHLTTLDLKESEEIVPEADILSMLRHCPNLCELGMPNIDETKDADRLTAAIAESCPALNELTYRSYCKDDADGVLMLRIMDLLSHSRSSASTAIQVLLVECRGLEVLKTRWPGERHGLCIELEDAIEFPWECTRIRDLNLAIGIPDEPLHRHLGVEPYYNRPVPITLSAAEREQFEKLEALYGQIGTLTQVEGLCLEVTFYDPEGLRPLSKLMRFNTFPGMLSIGDENTGRPGYLHHLVGLTKLRKLSGSVSAATDEAKVTVGLKEAEWMQEHWPLLKFDFIFPHCRTFQDVTRWLKD